MGPADKNDGDDDKLHYSLFVCLFCQVVVMDLFSYQEL